MKCFNPLVSIIIPTYNRVSFLGETLQSILDQKFQNFECIIIDDFSEDNTDLLLEFYTKRETRIKYFLLPKEKGRGANACRNYGIEISKGEYLLFFDSDDIIDREILHKSIKVFLGNNGLDFIFFNYMEFEGLRSNIIRIQDNKSNYPLRDYFSGKINLATPAILWKKKSLKENRFNEKLLKTQELDFVFNLYKKNNELVSHYLNFNGFFYRKHSNSILHSFFENKLDFVLSNIYVRKEIANYFSEKDFEIYLTNQSEVQDSIRMLLKDSNILTFLKVLKSLCVYEDKLFFLKLKICLTFYKFVMILFNRHHRFNCFLKVIFSKEFQISLPKLRKK